MVMNKGAYLTQDLGIVLSTSKEKKQSHPIMNIQNLIKITKLSIFLFLQS